MCVNRKRTNERNYRVVKVTYDNDKIYYYVQRECKHLRKYVVWGPKIWKTYEEIYDGNYSQHAGWSFAIRFGERFSRELDAFNTLIDLKSADAGRVIKDISVVNR